MRDNHPMARLSPYLPAVMSHLRQSSFGYGRGRGQHCHHGRTWLELTTPATHPKMTDGGYSFFILYWRCSRYL
jgi:hypothetical protein